MGVSHRCIVHISISNKNYLNIFHIQKSEKKKKKKSPNPTVTTIYCDYGQSYRASDFVARRASASDVRSPSSVDL